MALQNLGTDDYINVSRGIIPGSSRTARVGFSTVISTSDQTIWGLNSIVTYPATASQVTISSSSANDTSAGTGARTLTLTGLDTNFNALTETITLNGQTAVTSVNSYYRLTFMNVLSAGTGGVNAGTIYVGTGTVTAGVPATVYNLISVGFNRSTSAFTTIPALTTGYLVGLQFNTNQQAATAGAQNSITVKAISRPTNTNVFAISRILVGLGSNLPAVLPVPFTAGTDLELRASTASGTATVSADFEILLVTN